MDRQLLLPYMLSLVIAFGYAGMVWKWPGVARFVLGISFVFASFFNLWWALHSPGVYVQAYGPHAVPLYREFIYGAFSRHTTGFVISIALGQFVSGALTFAPLPWRRIGYVGAIVFLLAVSPLGVGAGFPSSVILAVAVGLLAGWDRGVAASGAASA